MKNMKLWLKESELSDNVKKQIDKTPLLIPLPWLSNELRKQWFYELITGIIKEKEWK